MEVAFVLKPWISAGGYPTRRRPDDGVNSPAAMFSSVDFPQPLGPTIATNEPARTAKEISSSARYGRPSGVAKSRQTRSNSIAVMARQARGPADLRQEALCGARDLVRGGALAVRAVPPPPPHLDCRVADPGSEGVELPRPGARISAARDGAAR